MPTYSVPSGYNHAAGLTVTGGSAAVPGSTSTPTTTSSDYVVQVHLTGNTAAAVFGNITDLTAFSDVSMWWWNGTGWVQIDCDVDQGTNAAWSASNITLGFKLQANLAISPATDANYMLAWGLATGGTITTMQNWANIYPFSDDFPGTSLSANWSLFSSTSASVASSVATFSITSQINWLGYALTSAITYGAGFTMQWFAQLPQQTVASADADVGFRGGNDWVSFRQFTSSTTDDFAQTQVASAQVANTDTGMVADSAYHSYTIARDPAGTSTVYTLDQRTPITTAHAADTAVKSAQVSLHNGNATTAATVTALVDWVKVRPYITTEPTTALGSILPTQGTVYIATTSQTAWSSAQTILQLAAPPSGSVELVRLRISVESLDINAPLGVLLYTATVAVTWTAPVTVTPVAVVGGGTSGCAVTAWGTGTVTDDTGKIAILEQGCNAASGYAYLPIPDEYLRVAAGTYLGIKLLGAPPSATWDVTVVWREAE